MLLRLGIPVLLCEAEVDDVDLVRLLPQSDQEVVGLDIAVYEVLGVHVFNTVDHLICQHQHGLQRELSIAKAKEILQGWPKQIYDHDIVISLDAVPMQSGNSYATRKNLVELRLVE